MFAYITISNMRQTLTRVAKNILVSVHNICTLYYNAIMISARATILAHNSQLIKQLSYVFPQ